MPIIPFEGHVPRIHPDAFVAPSAILIGDVEVGPNASIWYGAVLRGDIEPVRVGARSNVQDNSVLHTSRDCPCIVEEDVTVGHLCMLHGCTVRRGALIGMTATVLDRAIIGEEALVGAGALVTMHKDMPARHLIVGSPAKAVRELTPDEILANKANTDRYILNGPRHRKMLEEWGGRF